MILNKEQKENFKNAVKPLMLWLNDNIPTHAKVVVDCRAAELLEAVDLFIINNYEGEIK